VADPRKKRYLTTAEAAAELELPADTLYRWRRTPGVGPPYRQHGGLIRYLWDDIKAWDATTVRT
jgi:hypothetical protein